MPLPVFGGGILNLYIHIRCSLAHLCKPCLDSLICFRAVLECYDLFGSVFMVE